VTTSRTPTTTQPGLQGSDPVIERNKRKLIRCFFLWLLLLMGILGSGSSHLQGRTAKWSKEQYLKGGTRGGGDSDRGRAKCQKCGKPGLWTYECEAKNLCKTTYKARPSRSQQLKNPRLKPSLLRAADLLPELKDEKKKREDEEDKRNGSGGKKRGRRERSQSPPVVRRRGGDKRESRNKTKAANSDTYSYSYSYSDSDYYSDSADSRRSRSYSYSYSGSSYSYSISDKKTKD
jgi:hypothetical protein